MKKNLEKSSLPSLLRLIALCTVAVFGSASAGQWKPLCIEGSSCNAPYQTKRGAVFLGSTIDAFASGPLVTTDGLLLHHTPFEFPVIGEVASPVRHVFQLSTAGSEDFGDRKWWVSDAFSIQTASGRILSFGLYSAAAWFAHEEEVEIINWVGTVTGLHNAEPTGPPVIIDNVMYMGLSASALGDQVIYSSHDDGTNWIHKSTNIRLGESRYNLLENPEKNALWGIQEEYFESPGSLWESTDGGSNWQQVDDGSFPPSTVRVIHDPENSMISYALTNDGLFVSVNRGVSWQATSMTEPVHGLVFVQRNEPLSRVLTVGTDTGVKVSVDEGISWVNMSNGLLEIPYTVTYAHGMLIATSYAGYFTCNSVDCAGLGQSLPPAEENGVVEVVEFYNTKLGHYFLTASQADIDFIDQGKAGEGWVHTGEGFKAWSIGSTVEAANVCRFYGSVYPGPNSHFFTLSTQSCRSLLNLQETTPATEPRWNFENYAFSLMPPLEDQGQPCLDGFIPVYRAYNNGYQKGEDSNHRFVTNRDLFEPLIEQGWTEEGVVFCSPTE